LSSPGSHAAGGRRLDFGVIAVARDGLHIRVVRAHSVLYKSETIGFYSVTSGS
jgi:hypothetical protein